MRESDVHRTLRVPGSVRNRTGRGGRTVIAAALGALALLGACGVPLDDSARVRAPEDVPYDLLSSTTTTAAASDAGQDTTVCLASDGTLFTVGRDRRGATLLDLVTRGPTEGESRLGLRSAMDDDAISSVTTENGTASVELGEEFAEMPGNQQLLAVAQVTCTLTAQPGIARVAFLLSGERVDVPVQGGSLVSRPVTRSDYARLYAN